MESVEKEVEAEETAKTEEVTPVEAEAVTKPKKKKEEEEIVEEKTYTIPLEKHSSCHRRKRSPRAMHMIRAYIVKHMKIPNRAEEEDEEPPKLTITKEVNETHLGQRHRKTTTQNPRPRNKRQRRQRHRPPRRRRVVLKPFLSLPLKIFSLELLV